MSDIMLSRQFYATRPTICPYLSDRIEQRVVTRLATDGDRSALNELTLLGFRRSQRFAYRPACSNCQACVPVRIPAAEFRWSRGWRRIWRHNADLTATEITAQATDEQYALFKRYTRRRHSGGGMATMTRGDYRAMVEDAPAETGLVEFRNPEGRLIAVSLTDRLESGLSGVYKFFEPELDSRSLGSFVILWHVARAHELGLPYVYLGYWIRDCRKMAYKVRFKPLERLRRDGWQPLSDDEVGHLEP